MTTPKAEKPKRFLNNFSNSVMFRCFVFALFILSFSCNNEKNIKTTDLDSTKKETLDSTALEKTIDIFETNKAYIAEGFDFPVGKPNAQGYYNAQKFKKNNHLGDDWNGIKGGNTDLGDSIYAVANGYVSEARDLEGGWGNVIRITHNYKGELYESIYAHCDTLLVSPNTFVKKGDKIATIGNCNGIYLAHLHLEIRSNITMDIGGGYSNNTKGYLDPTAFIKANR